MEDKTKPTAPQPFPDDDRSAVFDAQASEESKLAGDPVDKPAEPAAPKAAPVEAPAAPKAAPVSAPQSPADRADRPAEPAAPKSAPDAAPAVPAEAPAQPAAPKTAPVDPQAPVAGSAAAPASAPAAAPTQPMGAPAQPGGPTPQPAAPMGAYPPPPAPNASAGNSKATVALVCGILAIVFSFIPIVGIILGIVAIVFAGKAVRMFGLSGKATGGKVCGILGIVFSVLMIVFTVAVMMIGFGAVSTMGSDYDDSVPAHVSSSNDSSSWSASGGAVDMDKDQQAVYDQVTVLFDGIVAKDAKFKDELSEEYGESFEQNFGATYAEMGIDPSAFAEWALTDFSYSIDSVFVEGDMATVYVDTTERDTFQFLMNFGDAVAAYSQTIDADTASDSDARAKVAELFSQTMADTAEMTTYFAAFDFKKQGDAWVIDEGSAEEEFDYMFGTF